MWPSWSIGLAASATITVAFLAVAAVLAVNLTRSRQWRRNPLGTGTFLLYLTCGGGHAMHTLQLVGPWFGVDAAAGAAARLEYSEWHTWVADGVTALAGVWYWTMRRKFPGLVTGAAVYEDLRLRQRQALEIHDNVVQGLARAKLALDLSRGDEGSAALEETLAASRRIVTELLGDRDIAPGDLRRSTHSAKEAAHGH
jgi:signal transduction histidine kinase